MKLIINPAALEGWRSAERVSRHDVAASATSHIGEIDGLRAIAIISVLVFHASGNLLGGGFVGVDVFFVISGYLITGILLADMDKGRLSLARFYQRRILRIAPALFVTLAATGLVFFVLLPPVLSGDLLASMVSAVLSYSNLWFYSTVDYFASNSVNPVLHTWSLAVEEQFYFLFPLLLLLIARSGITASKALVFTGLALLSLVPSSVVVGQDQLGAFYFPWLRAWELLVGSILATVAMERIPVAVRAGLSYLGLVLIGLACVSYNDRMAFPGYSAMLPCLGAAAIIAGAGSGSLANGILKSGFMRWTGKISYSLYLVHWPIACVAVALFSLHSIKVQIAVVTASFLTAWLSWRFVETPFRLMAGRVPMRRVLLVFALSGVVLCIFLLALQSASAFLWKRYPEALRYSEFLKTDLSFFRPGSCFLSPKHEAIENFSYGKCLKLVDDKENVLVIGDSHAANIVAALAEQHPSVNLLQATSAGCKPMLDAPGGAHCRILDVVYREWLPGAGARVGKVVIAARWEAGDVQSLKRTISHLHGLGKQVILYGPTPEYFVLVPLILAYEQIGSVPLADRFLKQERRRLDEQLRTEFSSQVTYFSAIDNLCGLRGCNLVEEKTPVFFDRDHLTPVGARRALSGFPLP